MEHMLKGETVKIHAFENKGKGVFEVEAVMDGKDVDFYVDSDGKFAGTEGPEDEEAEGNQGKGVTVYVGFAPADTKAKGVMVGTVMKDSPAAKAGLAEKDVIQELGGVQIKGSGKDAFDEFVTELRKCKPGDKLKMVVLRDGKQKNLSVTLIARPAGGEEDESGEGDEGDEGDESGEEGD